MVFSFPDFFQKYSEDNNYSFVFMWASSVIGRIKHLTCGDQNFQAWIPKAHTMTHHYFTMTSHKYGDTPLVAQCTSLHGLEQSQAQARLFLTSCIHTSI